MVPILQMRKPKLCEFRGLAQGHTAVCRGVSSHTQMGPVPNPVLLPAVEAAPTYTGQLSAQDGRTVVRYLPPWPTHISAAGKVL